jgi:hypothetical protein
MKGIAMTFREESTMMPKTGSRRTHGIKNIV